MTIGKKIVIMLGLICATTLVAIGVYMTSAYFFSANEFSKTFKNYKNISVDNSSISENKPISILLMGVDTGTYGRTDTWEGNSDTMIVVTVNPKTKKTTMTSLERDIYTELTGPSDNDMNGVAAKLNAAYAAGGAEMALMTINALLNMNIDYYMQMNMQGLVDLVNAVGGITVTNHFDFPISIVENEPDYTATVEPGTHKINGDQALVFARMRYDDPEGDYGRQKRQREVIQKVMQKILSLDSVASYRKILSAVSSNMQTNIEINSSTIPSLLGYADALKSIKSYQLEGEGQDIDGVSYQLTTDDHLLSVQNRIKKALGLETSDTLKTSAITYEAYYGLSSSYVTTDDGTYTSDVSGYDTYSTAQDYTTYATNTYPADTYSNTGQTDVYNNANTIPAY
ncbi:biofilm formation/cell division transcriptional regulator BrpA [Streptococcus sp. zg-JUN1979]|uniref:glycopolymer--peptidoglycan transferase LytR n=1 Tax=Streptococcus sp. zg-JUN1979 TaxID=3391450 RepID=UPI0039A45706